MTKLILFNTASRKKELFEPIDNTKVGLYSCGPTVYNYAHIGNLRTYIFNDILRRTLKKNNFTLNHVMNITDVGHLTSDADEGEDKMLAGAKREKKTVWEIAEFYTEAFFNDMNLLNLEQPETICKATDHIKEMIEMNSQIEKNNHAYESGGNLYFDTSSIEDYGKLAKLKLENLQEGARVDKDQNKKNPTDFVLWFTKSKFQDQEMKWESPWGTGYPGWHIECSAMSTKYLGDQFDIHTGGIDHIPVHHTNEIAQSEAATNKKPWVKYWVHGEFLVIDKDKMAKSGDNFLRLQTLIDKGYDPLAYKYFCFTAHYRSKLNFSWDGLDSAQQSFNSLKKSIIEIKKNESSTQKEHSYESDFLESINDDLNIPKAMGVVWSTIRDNKLGNKEKYELLLGFDEVLGFNFQEWEEEKVDIPSEVQDLVLLREEARKNKEWDVADRLREQIREKGFDVDDGSDGTGVKKI